MSQPLLLPPDIHRIFSQGGTVAELTERLAEYFIAHGIPDKVALEYARRGMQAYSLYYKTNDFSHVFTWWNSISGSGQLTTAGSVSHAFELGGGGTRSMDNLDPGQQMTAGSEGEVALLQAGKKRGADDDDTDLMMQGGIDMSGISDKRFKEKEKELPLTVINNLPPPQPVYQPPQQVQLPPPPPPPPGPSFQDFSRLLTDAQHNATHQDKEKEDLKVQVEKLKHEIEEFKKRESESMDTSVYVDPEVPKLRDEIAKLKEEINRDKEMDVEHELIRLRGEAKIVSENTTLQEQRHRDELQKQKLELENATNATFEERVKDEREKLKNLIMTKEREKEDAALISNATTTMREEIEGLKSQLQGSAKDQTASLIKDNQELRKQIATLMSRSTSSGPPENVMGLIQQAIQNQIGGGSSTGDALRDRYHLRSIPSQTQDKKSFVSDVRTGGRKPLTDDRAHAFITDHDKHAHSSKSTTPVYKRIHTPIKNSRAGQKKNIPLRKK